MLMCQIMHGAQHMMKMDDCNSFISVFCSLKKKPEDNCQNELMFEFCEYFCVNCVDVWVYFFPLPFFFILVFPSLLWFKDIM